MIYYDQLLDKLKAKVGTEKKKDLASIDLVKYASTLKKDLKSENKIAVIYAEGEIVDGDGDEWAGGCECGY